MTQMWKVLREARDAQGWSLDDATFHGRTCYPNLRIGRMKIHRLESGPVDWDRVDFAMVLAFAELYGLRPGEIDPRLEAVARDISEVCHRLREEASAQRAAKRGIVPSPFGH